MTPEWWAEWGRGLMERVYPIMGQVMKPEYLDLWVQGLYNRLREEGVPEAVAIEIVKAA